MRVGTWAGWVYINMDPDAESLEEFLSPAKAILDPFRMQDFRYHWRKSTILPCNWKTALEAFDEGYHVQTTHRQLLEYIDDVTVSFAQGRHGMFAYWDSLPPGNRSRRLTSEPTRRHPPGAPRLPGRAARHAQLGRDRPRRARGGAPDRRDPRGHEPAAKC